MSAFIRAFTLIFMLSFIFVAVPVRAEYPDKPMNMIMAFTAGGSSDVQARLMQKYWDKAKLPQWVFIYKTGAGGAIGFGEIAKAKKDGYTLGGINVPHIVLQPLGQKAQFSIDSFDYICQVVNDPQCIAVHKDSPFKNVKEVFEFAKANPGKLKLGLVGRLSGHHLMLLDVQSKYDFPVTDVVYKGAADQNAALLGKEIDVIFGNLNDVMRSLEHMRVLGLAAEKRDKDFLPDVPILKEEGYDVVSDIRRAFVVPKGVDPEQLKFLRAAFEKIAKDPEYIAEMKKIGQPQEYMDGESFAKYVKEQNEKAKITLEKAGLLKN
ncbi:tripartite tricarboxylate transporter substrate binding protein [Desulfovibrio litoralis]|uniref:Tripartite-type tricarboxylate transporter, receptor component TctC n=1 Tax=Desulfovibrio litoralis DSM 11393 TaxID=1121455 RepID=A0A1M7T3Q5_9BACT|nr:tripartite tricarboxylate transporter substrate binding protein [Desulfovibrio litoralis]SHN65339.1 Tripartite-type tricarboxylate transporter, receptor component TctC [Desulfovibrio litoralis DSM 11393]